MNTISTYPVIAKYNHWINQRLYALCAEIPDEIRKEDRGAFFKSIHGTLNHLLFGDRRWMERFTGKPFTGSIGEELYSDFSELHHEREITDLEILDWSQQLTTDWLAQPFSWTSNVDGSTRTQPTWVLVTHLFNHQTHHRGQLTTLLMQLGYNPGCTDLPWMPYLFED